MTCAEPSAWAKRECSAPGNASAAAPRQRIRRNRWTSRASSRRGTICSTSLSNEMSPWTGSRRITPTRSTASRSDLAPRSRGPSDMLRAAPEMATCSKCGFVMDERTRPPKCPRCATPTQPATFAPPGATRPGAPPGPARPGPRNLEPVGAPPVFGGAAPTTGTASGQTLYGLPMPDDGDELTMLGGDDSGPLDETRKTSGPPTIDSAESSGQFDAAALFGEVDLAAASDESLELDLP